MELDPKISVFAPRRTTESTTRNIDADLACRLRCPLAGSRDCRPSVAPPSVGHEDPEHPVDRPEPRTFGGALHLAELLPEDEVLKDQFMMSLAHEGERSDETESHLQHATDPVMLRADNQSALPGLSFGDRQGN
jgi:hypothetical protein